MTNEIEVLGAMQTDIRLLCLFLCCQFGFLVAAFVFGNLRVVVIPLLLFASDAFAWEFWTVTNRYVIHSHGETTLEYRGAGFRDMLYAPSLNYQQGDFWIKEVDSFLSRFRFGDGVVPQTNWNGTPLGSPSYTFRGAYPVNLSGDDGVDLSGYFGGGQQFVQQPFSGWTRFLALALNGGDPVQSRWWHRADVNTNELGIVVTNYIPLYSVLDNAPYARLLGRGVSVGHDLFSYGSAPITQSWGGGAASVSNSYVTLVTPNTWYMDDVLKSAWGLTGAYSSARTSDIVIRKSFRAEVPVVDRFEWMADTNVTHGYFSSRNVGSPEYTQQVLIVHTGKVRIVWRWSP